MCITSTGQWWYRGYINYIGVLIADDNIAAGYVNVSCNYLVEIENVGSLALDFESESYVYTELPTVIIWRMHIFQYW